ncbi:CLUMA_CG001685, isoform A [Clunio marinus]|uniref:CLUMA_CG001685, isoform A n=1 Tax=Clunio marinus TaxID=568069 RepID=A0A1J1HK23_9DIPT|nr:CLUMA_CG001685, isoform A [Clunio marinus]
MILNTQIVITEKGNDTEANCDEEQKFIHWLIKHLACLNIYTTDAKTFQEVLNLFEVQNSF